MSIFKKNNNEENIVAAREIKQSSKLKKFFKSLLFFIPLVALIGLFTTGKVNLGPSSPDAQSSDNNANAGNRRGGRRGGQNGDDEEKEILIPVETDNTSTHTLYAFYTGTASLYAENKTEVAAKIGGQVTRLNAEEGDIVRAGQTLAQIESDRLRLEIKRAQANLDKITQDITRKQDLYEQKLIPRESFESLRYDKQSAEAALALAKLDLSYTSIRSPISGVVSARNVQRGNTVGTNQVVYEVTSLATLQADLFIPERELANIRLGQQAQVNFDALQNGQALDAKIKRISPVIDSKTGTFKTTLELSNKNGQLKPGMFGRFKVVFDEHANVMTLPRTAIIEVDNERSVYHIIDDKSKKLIITTGYENDGLVEIASGLNGDEAVVIQGQAGLRIGSKVNVIKGPNPRTPEYQTELDKKEKEKTEKEAAKKKGQEKKDAGDTESGDADNAGG